MSYVAGVVIAIVAYLLYEPELILSLLIWGALEPAWQWMKWRRIRASPHGDDNPPPAPWPYFAGFIIASGKCFVGVFLCACVVIPIEIYLVAFRGR